MAAGVDVRHHVQRLNGFLTVVERDPQRLEEKRGDIVAKFQILSRGAIPGEFQQQVGQLMRRWDHILAQAPQGAADVAAEVLGIGPAAAIPREDPIRALLEREVWLNERDATDTVTNPDPCAFLQVLCAPGGPARTILYRLPPTWDTTSNPPTLEVARYFGYIQREPGADPSLLWILKGQQGWTLNIRWSDDGAIRLRDCDHLLQQVGVLVSREDAGAAREQVAREFGLAGVRRPQGLPQDLPGVEFAAEVRLPGAGPEGIDLQRTLQGFEEEIRAQKARQQSHTQYYQEVLRVCQQYLDGLSRVADTFPETVEEITRLSTYFKDVVNAIMPNETTLNLQACMRICDEDIAKHRLVDEMIRDLDAIIRICGDTASTSIKNTLRPEMLRIKVGLEGLGWNFFRIR